MLREAVASLLVFVGTVVAVLFAWMVVAVDFCFCLVVPGFTCFCCGYLEFGLLFLRFPVMVVGIYSRFCFAICWVMF